MVPYVVERLRGDSALVRGASVRTLTQIIPPEHIFSNVTELMLDPDISVRWMYGQCIVPLAETGVRYLEMDHSMTMQGTLRLTEEDNEDSLRERTCDAGSQEIQSLIQ